MKVLINILTVSLIAIMVQAEPGSMMIRTLNGLVRGKKVEFKGKVMDSYLGIPYAVPPLGKLRFKHPVPIGTWGHVMETDKLPNSCVQRELAILRFNEEANRLLPSTNLTEDCLYLNVFVPRNAKPKSEVMIFIHGGAFSTGSTSAPFYDPQVFAIVENLIVVDMNYRLASLGFLYLDHPDFEPNRGLMDQLLAMKWVQDNIFAFGGDPKKITLMGLSAGGMSVTLHMLSPLSRNIFNRAILESGTALSDWTILSHEDALKQTYRLARNMNCANYDDRDSIATCFQNADAEFMVDKEPIEKYYYFVFKPIVDGKIVPEYPIQAYKNRRKMPKIDLLLGTTHDEGSIFLSAFLPRVFIPFTDKIYAKHSHLMQVIDKFFEYEPDLVRTVMLKHFTSFDMMETSQGIVKMGERMMREYLMDCPTNNMEKWYAGLGSRVYSYIFNYRTSVSLYARWLGVVHGETTRYSLGDVCREPYRPRKDTDFSKRLMRYYGNFVRTGDPNIGEGTSDPKWIYWPRFTPENRTSFVLAPGINELRVRTPDEKACNFWDETIYELREAAANVS